MAQNILNTRIKLKYDTLANWTTNKNFVPLKGEVCLVEVPTGASEKQVTPPAILSKVGDGVKTFEQLPYTSALAADVYAWAKQSGITVEDNGTGKFVTDVSWNNDKIVITRDNVALADVQGLADKLNDYVLKSEAPGYDDILTKTDAATTYLGINAKAVDADKLDNHDSSYFATDADLAETNSTVRSIQSTMDTYGDIVTHDSDEFDAAGEAEQALEDAKDYADELISGLGAVLKFKGTKATEAELKAITIAAIGDVYVVTEDSSEWVATEKLEGLAKPGAWQKFGTTDVKGALYKDTNDFTDGYILKADGTSGKVKAVVADKTAVGLDNVDNTSDMNKPVSTAQATAIATAKTEAINTAEGYTDTAIAGLDSSIAVSATGKYLTGVTITDGKLTAKTEADIPSGSGSVEGSAVKFVKTVSLNGHTLTGATQDADTAITAAATSIPTTAAVKTYVDAQISGDGVKSVTAGDTNISVDNTDTQNPKVSIGNHKILNYNASNNLVDLDGNTIIFDCGSSSVNV